VEFEIVTTKGGQGDGPGLAPENADRGHGTGGDVDGDGGVGGVTGVTSSVPFGKDADGKVVGAATGKV
jgi:hypothetical protein